MCSIRAHVAQMRPVSSSFGVVAVIICAQHVAHAQFTVRLLSQSSTLVFGAYAHLFVLYNPGASIDVRDLFLLFRLGVQPARSIALPCRRLCPGGLRCSRGYVFSFISLASRPRQLLVARNRGLYRGVLTVLPGTWQPNSCRHSESSSFSYHMSFSMGSRCFASSANLLQPSFKPSD